VKVWLARHGEAGDYLKDPKAERERPLTPEGRKIVAAIARAMKDAGEEPRTILTSEYARAYETADIIGKAFGCPVDIVSSVAPHMPLAHALEVLAEEDEQRRVMIVAHSDNINPWVERVTGDEDDFAKGEVRRYRVDRADGSAKERWRCCPSDVGFKDEF
jgi:phosphohistidine phosphatase SixA